MFRFIMGGSSWRVWIPALAWVVALTCLIAASAPIAAAVDRDPRDFPPLVDPNRPVAPDRWETPTAPPAVEAPRDSIVSAEMEAYRLGVGDEVQINVLSAPEFNGLAKVRPDGAITVHGVGEIHALGRTPAEVGREAEQKLSEFLRHARVDLSVTNYGESRVFVMGEVEQPGERPYYKGMSALQAVASAGGISGTGKSGSTLVLRRTGSGTAEVRKVDLGRSLKGEPGQDIVLHPYDIVYVPRTLIARADLAIDQYLRQMIAPFTLYLEGWKAFNIGTDNVKVVETP